MMALQGCPACFETRRFATLLSMRIVEDGGNKRPHAEEARRAVSKHAVGVSRAISIGVRHAG